MNIISSVNEIKNYIKYNVVEMKVIKRNFVVLRLA